jgi:hypothetical protein
MAFLSRLLSVCPRLLKDGGKLIAKSAWRLRILSLGSYCRQVTIDPRKKELILRRRYGWFFSRRRRVRFQTIETVTYGYHDWALSGVFSWAHDSCDLFSVGVRMHDGEEMHLFYFYGDGTFTNNSPWPDWFYWEEYLTDLSGTQDRESKGFVELLSKMIGVSVSPPRS